MTSSFPVRAKTPEGPSSRVDFPETLFTAPVASFPPPKGRIPSGELWEGLHAVAVGLGVTSAAQIPPHPGSRATSRGTLRPALWPPQVQTWTTERGEGLRPDGQR